MTPEDLEAESRHVESLIPQAEAAIKAESLTELGASWLRTRLRINYATAVHLMDRLEQAGDIGPAGETRLRPVFMVTAGFSIFD